MVGRYLLEQYEVQAALPPHLPCELNHEFVSVVQAFQALAAERMVLWQASLS